MIGSSGEPSPRSPLSSPGVIEPQRYLAYLREIGQLSEFPAPPNVVLCYQNSLLRHVLDTENTLKCDPRTGYREMVTLSRTAHRVGVLSAGGFGAPAAVAVVEELIALGTRRIVTVGTAGALLPQSAIADVLTCHQAVRDDGISGHYLPAGQFAAADSTLTDRLESMLTRRGVPHQPARTWTTGAIYRETEAAIDHYARLGVAAVEMEAAAVFAVGEFRQIPVASVMVIADILPALPWRPQWSSPLVLDALVKAYETAVDVLNG